jgi:hypothetical protein
MGKKWGFWTFFVQGVFERFFKQKVPPAYSRADENARSLTAVGMTTILDELKARDRLKPIAMMTIFKKSKNAHFE